MIDMLVWEEAWRKLDRPYFLLNREWYTKPGLDLGAPEDAGRAFPWDGYELTDKAPEEAVASYNHCFNISPDGKKIIPYFLTNRAWFGVHRKRVKEVNGRVFFLKAAAPPEAVWSHWSFYEDGRCEHVIPYFMLDESWYERDENGSVARLTGKAPYLARASFADFMNPYWIEDEWLLEIMDLAKRIKAQA